MAATCPECSTRLPWYFTRGVRQCSSCGTNLKVESGASQILFIFIWMIAELPLLMLIPSDGLMGYAWLVRTVLSGVLGVSIWFVISSVSTTTARAF